MAIEIIPFDDQHAGAFRELNLEWLRQYFTVEPYDEWQLSNPGSEIIGKGGYIFLAKEQNMIVGTVALAKQTDRSYELTKMCVTERKRGRGVGKLLMETCIRLGQEHKWQRLFLYSSTKLVTAIQLYRKYGFTEIPLEANSHYQRTNIKMELPLNT